jgi:hypothetical protein
MRLMLDWSVQTVDAGYLKPNDICYFVLGYLNWLVDQSTEGYS